MINEKKRRAVGAGGCVSYNAHLQVYIWTDTRKDLRCMVFSPESGREYGSAWSTVRDNKKYSSYWCLCVYFLPGTASGLTDTPRSLKLILDKGDKVTGHL